MTSRNIKFEWYGQTITRSIKSSNYFGMPDWALVYVGHEPIVVDETLNVGMTILEATHRAAFYLYKRLKELSCNCPEWEEFWKIIRYRNSDWVRFMWHFNLISSEEHSELTKQFSTFREQSMRLYLTCKKQKHYGRISDIAPIAYHLLIPEVLMQLETIARG